MISRIKSFIKKLVPRNVLSVYHRSLSFLAALASGFPAKSLTVILVTGTKGKSTVSEFIYTILKNTGHEAALISTIKFALPKETLPNKLKMTMPGRGKIHHLLKKARRQGATHAVIEATSEGTLQHRHTFLFPDILVFTNLQKEHIEAHGSFENYKNAKLTYAKEIQKNDGVVVANADDPHAKDFLTYTNRPISFSKDDLKNLALTPTSLSFVYKKTPLTLPLPGVFNAMNAAAALKVAEQLQIEPEKAVRALEQISSVRGRTEFISAGQDFDVVVDYAHTPDSLIALYKAFPNKKKICVLGNTGGGRDTWKRPRMGEIADTYCDHVILTNEDPYDEDPQQILDQMKDGMAREPEIIMDRREAIRRAIRLAQKDDVVLISGKGTDPFIMGPHGTKIPWDDASVAREELADVVPKNL